MKSIDDLIGQIQIDLYKYQAIKNIFPDAEQLYDGVTIISHSVINDFNEITFSRGYLNGVYSVIYARISRIVDFKFQGYEFTTIVKYPNVLIPVSVENNTILYNKMAIEIDNYLDDFLGYLTDLREYTGFPIKLETFPKCVQNTLVFA